jgi:hypothetical protein
MLATIIEGELELADVSFLIGFVSGLVAAVMYAVQRSVVGTLASLALAAIAFGLLAL